MKELTHVHKILITLLESFIDVANKHNLEWFLDGGSLLGTVRKNELIPWDDDIDIIMPRTSFNMLLTLSKEFKEPIFLQTCDTDKNYYSFTPKLRYSNSAMITAQELEFSYNKGIAIDILPLDNIPDDNNDDWIKLCKAYTKLVNNRLGMRFVSHKEINVLLKTSQIDFSTISKAWNETMTAMNILYEHSHTCADTMWWWSSTYSSQIFTKEEYSSYMLMTLKDCKYQVRVPVGYKTILEKWYGPTWYIEKDEGSGHSFLNNFIYDTAHSYKDYECLDKDTLIQMIKKGDTLQ